MYYTLYRIDDKNKIIYVKIEDHITDSTILSNMQKDHERIVKFANKNNYLIEIYNEKDNDEDYFSFKRHL